MRSAAGLGFLLALGVWVGHALAAAPGPNQLPTTSLPLTTALPKVTTTVPLPTSTTLPKLPTTTTVPKLPTTTTVPKLPTTTTVPKLPTTTTVPKLPTTTTVPIVPSPPATTTSTNPVSQVTTTATSATSTSPLASATKTAGSLASATRTESLAAADARSFGSSPGLVGAGTNAGPSGGPSNGSPSNGSPQVQQLEQSRPFITTRGPKSKRKITLTFVLSHRARVVFAVQQVSPVCRTVGYFSVQGRKGTNRVRFAGRVGRKRLGPGTYTIFARTRGGQLVQRVTLVVVNDSTPSRAQIRAASAANVCSATLDVFAAPRLGGASISFASRGRAERPSEKPFAGAPPNVTEPHSGGVLGTTAEEAAHAVRPFLVGLLVAAILALGLASLPRVAVVDNRLSDALARHRIGITSIGAAALVAVAIAFLIG